DGIRDFHVTGVQTCALPIYRRAHRPAAPCLSRGGDRGGSHPHRRMAGRRVALAPAHRGTLSEADSFCTDAALGPTTTCRRGGQGAATIDRSLTTSPSSRLSSPQFRATVKRAPIGDVPVRFAYRGVS